MSLDVFNTTVIIPTKNRPLFLKRALNSLVNQSVKPKSVIVIDDCSINVDYDFINEFESTIDCDLIINPRSRGGAYSRNIGIENANTEFLTFLDDDDAFENEFLANVMKATQKYTQADAFYSSKKFVLSDTLDVVKRTKVENTHVTSAQLLTGNSVGTTSCVTLRRTAVPNLCFDEALPALQDYELWLRLSLSGIVFKPVSNAFVFYTVNITAAQISGNYNNHLAAGKHINNKYEELLDKYEQTLLRKTIAFMELKAVHRRNYYASLPRTISLFRQTFNFKIIAFMIPYRMLNKLGLYTT